MGFFYNRVNMRDFMHPWFCVLMARHGSQKARSFVRVQFISIGGNLSDGVVDTRLRAEKNRASSREEFCTSL